MSTYLKQWPWHNVSLPPETTICKYRFKGEKRWIPCQIKMVVGITKGVVADCLIAGRTVQQYLDARTVEFKPAK